MAEHKANAISLSSVAMPVLAVAAACAIFYFAAPILVPMTIAAATAYILTPVVEFLKRFKMPHWLAVLIVMIVLLSLGGFIMVFALAELGDLALKLPAYQQSIHDTIAQIQNWMNVNLAQYPGLSLNLEKYTLDPANISKAGGLIFKGIGSVTSLMLSGFLLFFLTYFILSDYQMYVYKLAMLFGQKQKEAQLALLNQINRQIRGFLIIKLAVTVGMAIVVTIGLIILGVPYAYIWGPLAGILNLIPYIGPIIGAVPPIIVAGIANSSLGSMIYVAIFFFILQMLESNIITPRITSRTIDLNPLAVLVSSIIWGYLWGGMGLCWLFL